MAKPVIKQREPYMLQLTPGQRYAWCSCGQSQQHPFCDGSHKGSDFLPTVFTAKGSHIEWICGCSYTATPPFCDAKHNKLDKILGNKKPAGRGLLAKLFKPKA